MFKNRIADTEDNLQKATHKLNQIIIENDLTISATKKIDGI